MTRDRAEAILEALKELWKGRGATTRDIRKQSVLMGLSYVIAGAAERTGEAEPTPAAIAEECRRCIIAATELLLGGEDAPYDRDNNAVAARIVLGVAQGTSSTTRTQRVALLSRTLDIPEDSITHKRDRGSYYEDRLCQVSRVMTDCESAFLGED
jgi:hypothetical protein